MKFCKNCGHQLFAHIEFANAETHELVGMVCTGTDSKDDNQKHTMEASRNLENGRLTLRPTCQCREIEILRKPLPPDQTTLS